jgi:hypothetical protein
MTNTDKLFLFAMEASRAEHHANPRGCTSSRCRNGGVTTLAKMDALIAAIFKESGFLEKVLS